MGTLGRGGLRRGRRAELLFLVLTLAVAGAALFVVLSRPGTPVRDGGDISGVAAGTIQTRWGPLSDKDRDFLAKVRQAGLWESPSGQQAQQRGSGQRVKEIGAMIANEHITLDEDVRTVANQLNVVLPSKPNNDQQKWMAELSGLSGEEYDRHFAYRLRAAHGKVFAVIADIRANTANSLVRDFAARANAFVLRHMSYLESTGLVDYQQVHT